MAFLPLLGEMVLIKQFPMALTPGYSLSITDALSGQISLVLARFIFYSYFFVCK